MKLTIILLLIVIAPIKGYTQKSQPPLLKLQKAWQRIIVNQAITIDLPPTLEIQSGAYKMKQNDVYKQIGLDTPQFVIQQIGLNESEINSFDSYARMMIKTTIGHKGQYDRLNFDTLIVSKYELDYTDSILHDQLKSKLLKQGVQLLE